MKPNPYHKEFGNTLEAFVYPALLLAVLWSVFLVEKFHADWFVQLGILPRHFSGLKGVIFSPLIHDPKSFHHILSNTLPAAILTGALVYFYRRIAARIFFISWILSGFLVWATAADEGHYHIGFSGVIYALAAFLFTSGTLRKYRPLQAISLFVAFFYGSMVWGIFPLEEGISWQGHLFGLAVGVALAFVYRHQGPQAPRYQYEIEKELGIEPPDLEGIWLENQRLADEAQRMQEAINESTVIHYIYREKQPNPPQDEKPHPE